MVSFCIIVARYNENLEWTKPFSNVIVYNKGEKMEDEYNEIFLDNVGREGHTYYTYICENYDNLSDYTIFLQGYPFDHSPNIIHNMNNYINNPNLNIDFEFLSENMHYSTIDNERNKNCECENIHKTWEHVFNTKCENNECIFGAGAQFIVAKNKILQHPKEFYENIVKILGYSICPFEGYDIERFHKYIFM
jgi:hypothetical protein